MSKAVFIHKKESSLLPAYHPDNKKEYKNDDTRMKSLVLEGNDYNLNNKAFLTAESLINEWR